MLRTASSRLVALNAFHAFTDPKTGAYIEDIEALNILRGYVTICQNVKNPSFVKTSGHHDVTKQLYERRRGNTHHVPLSIMVAGSEVPEDFHFGYITGQGTPALAFCRAAMSLIREVHQKLQA